MIVGDRLHFFRVCCLGYNTQSTQKLHVDELPIKLIAFNYEFQVGRDVFGGNTRHGKAVLLKFSNSAVFAKHINDFIEANNGTDLSYEALVLIKIQRKGCTTKDETCINFVPSAILTMCRSKYGNVQVDSDNL